MAYTALVRSACASATAPDGVGYDETFSLAWYCVQLLLDTIGRLSLSSSPEHQTGKGKGQQSTKIDKEEERSSERVHRLHLTLISTLSALPLKLLGKALDEVYKIIIPTTPTTTMPTTPISGTVPTAAGKGNRELVEALFREILEGVGDREKGYAMSWWYEHRKALLDAAGALDLEEAAKSSAAAAEDGDEVKEAKAAAAGSEEKVANSSRARL